MRRTKGVLRVTTCRPKYYSNEHWRLVGEVSCAMYGSGSWHSMYVFEKKKRKEKKMSKKTQQGVAAAVKHETAETKPMFNGKQESSRSSGPAAVVPAAASDGKLSGKRSEWLRRERRRVDRGIKESLTSWAEDPQDPKKQRDFINAALHPRSASFLAALFLLFYLAGGRSSFL